MRSPSGSGSVVVVIMPNMWKVRAPNQMPNAIARPPMSVRPGYFTSIRKPSLKSSEKPLNQAVPRPSRIDSRWFCTPPNAASARRRASSRESPASRTRRSVSMSRWKRNSSSVRDSLARRDRDSRARVRAALSQLMGCSGSEAVATWRQRPRVSKCDSGGAQHGLEAGGEAAPALQLVAKRLAARGGDPVVAGTPVVVSGSPIARDQAVLLEALERGIERALVHLEHTVGDLLDALADPPPVHGSERQRLEDQQVERAPEGIGLGSHGHGGLRRKGFCSW